MIYLILWHHQTLCRKIPKTTFFYEDRRRVAWEIFYFKLCINSVNALVHISFPFRAYEIFRKQMSFRGFLVIFIGMMGFSRRGYEIFRLGCDLLFEMKRNLLSRWLWWLDTESNETNRLPNWTDTPIKVYSISIERLFY